jgi:hypothetical protein
LALLDADDVWLPNKLAEQVALLDTRPDVAMLYGNSLYWYSWTGDSRDAGRDYCLGGVPLPLGTDALDILAGYLRGSVMVPCPCSVIARRATVEQVGGFEESIGTIQEDQAFFAKMLIAGPVHVATQTWDRYRIHPDSACAIAERDGQFLATRLAYLDWLEAYLKQQAIEHRRVWSSLRADRWRCRHPGIGRRVAGVERRLRRLAATVRAAAPEPVRKTVRRVVRQLSRASR